MIKISISLLFIFLFSTGIYAQQLTIPQIMQGEEFVGYLPEDLMILPNDVPVFSWKQEGDNERTYYKIADDQPVKLNDREKVIFPLWGYEWNKDRTKAAYAFHGNLFLWERSKDDPTPLIITSQQIYNVGWAGDDIYFSQEDNIYEFNLEKGRVTQLTNFVNHQEPMEIEPAFLEKQQEELFDFISPKEQDEKYSLLPKAIYTGDKLIRNRKLSPYGTVVTYTSVELANPEKTEVTHHITASGYTKNTNARPKVGREDDKHSFFVYNIDKQENNLIDFNSLSKLDQIPFYYSEYSAAHDEYTNKGLYFHGPYYSPSGDRSILEIKSLDNKHRWIVELDLEKASFKELEYQHDEAWIGGPGISGWNEVPGNIEWISDDVFFFQSEESGYSHLYTYNFKTGKKEQVTKGKYEIHATIPTNKPDEWIVVANKTHPGNRGVYRLNFSKKTLSPILEKEGKYDPVFTEDQTKMYYLYSYKNQPTELYGKTMKGKGIEHVYTDSQTAEFKAYDWYAPEVITFMSVDALYDVYARLYKPEESKKNGAAVIFVHGAGYLQNAHNYWSLYYREYMFHNLLRDEGYTILDIDYRASEGYGRDWRTAIYRHMGGKDLLDQMGGREYLISELGIDEDRIGIYGGSYGGFMTLMALLTEPGKFACGAALRSVTDWAHYNHEYTSNILNTPEEDSVAFYRSSPINFAENLEDPLIMLHGMVDDNVQFQDVVRLSQRFIELGKQDWEMAIFPVEPHGFKTASSWTDEYTRIYKLFETHLKAK